MGYIAGSAKKKVFNRTCPSTYDVHHMRSVKHPYRNFNFNSNSNANLNPKLSTGSNPAQH